MARVTKETVEKALREAEEADRDLAATLRPEDLDRIKAVYAETDPVAFEAKRSALLDAMERQLETGSRRFAEAQAAFGLEAGQTKRFLQGDRFSAEVAGDVEAAIQSSIGEAEREARAAASAARRGGRPARPRAGRITV